MLDKIMAHSWRHLQADSAQTASVEFETSGNIGWLMEIAVGEQVSAHGVRLVVKSMNFMKRPDAPSIYRVRIEFYRMDVIEREQRARALAGPRAPNWLVQCMAAQRD